MHNRRFLPSIGKYTSNTIGNSREAVILIYAIKIFRTDIALLILNVCTKWEWSTSRPGWFDLRKERRHPLGRRLGRSP